jgi:hypothetical protein
MGLGLAFADRAWVYGPFSDFRVVFLSRANSLPDRRGRAIYGHHSTPHCPNTHNMYTIRICAGSNTNTQGLEQDVEDPCGRYVVGVKFKPRGEIFGWCALTTATEHAVGDVTPPLPLAVQPAEVGPKRCAGVPATARSGVRKKTDGACPSPRIKISL